MALTPEKKVKDKVKKVLVDAGATGWFLLHQAGRPGGERSPWRDRQGLCFWSFA